MIDEEALKKSKQYAEEYKRNWGKDVDITAIPDDVTQTEMADILERIKETGESILVGYEKLNIKHINKF